MHEPRPTPEHTKTPTTAPAKGSPSAAAPSPLWRRLLRWSAWSLLAVFGLVLAALLTAWLWAASPGSLAQVLGWTQRWMQGKEASVGQLQTDRVEGSLRGGGRVGSLRWSLNGLSVQADGVQLQWNDRLWVNALLGRGVHLPALRMESLTVNDTRPVDPNEPPFQPLTELVLPLPFSLNWSVGQFKLAGKSSLTLSDMAGVYRYGAASKSTTVAALDAPPTGALALPALPDRSERSGAVQHSHRLWLTSLRLAEGRYTAQLQLGAETPMPLALQVQANVSVPLPNGPVQRLRGQASASGQFAGADGRLEIKATATGDAPAETAAAPATGANRSAAPSQQGATLALSASVKPQATQPLVRAQVESERLDLAGLWQGAPRTVLSGHIGLVPEGKGWRAQWAITNSASGPTNQQRLPLDSLQGELAQNGERWTLSRLQAALGGGQLQGQAAFTLAPGQSVPSQWTGQFSASALRADQLWSNAPTAAWDARVSAEAAQPNGAVNLRIGVTPTQRQPAGAADWVRNSLVELTGRWQPSAATASQGTLDIASASLRVAELNANAQGRVATAPLSYDGPWTLALPGAQAKGSGRLAPDQGRGQAELQLTDAARALAWARDLQSLPVVGPPLEAALKAQAQWVVQGNANAQLEWDGGLAALGWPTANPAAHAAAQTPKANWPTLKARVSVPRLQWQTTANAPPTVLSDWTAQANGRPSDMALQLQGQLATNSWQVRLNTQGQLQAERLARASLSLDPLELRVQRQVSAADGNNGNKSANPTDTPAPTAWTLASAAPLALRWQQPAGGALSFDAGSGRLLLRPAEGRGAGPTEPLTLAWDSLALDAQALRTQGRLQGLSMAWVDALAGFAGSAQGGVAPPTSLLAAAGLSGDLLLDGEWNLSVPAAPPGATGATGLALSAALQRRSGDLRLLLDGSPNRAPGAPAAQPPMAAGIRDARIGLRLEGGQAKAELRWDTERLGQASADLSTDINTHGSAEPASDASALDRWWPSSAAIRGTAKASLPQVGVWSLLAPPGWRVSGTMEADATLSGTRGTPRFQGKLEGHELALRSLVDGLDFTGGQVRASLDGDQLTVQRLSVNGPGGAQAGGSLEASGRAEWRPVPDQPNRRQAFLDLQATANSLRVSSRADRRLALSGTASARLAGTDLQIRGQLKADSALFILPNELAPSLSKDVVVRSTRTVPTPPQDPNRVQPNVEVSLDLGPDFEVQGRGLKTRLEGQVTVRSAPAQTEPRAFGEVRTVAGTYRAYGQQLNIETGVLRFTGPYDDPALDILALRQLPENVDQRVGVQINGSAADPRVRLYAEPDLPDADKLGWLVLGKPASASGAQAFVLQQAARQLLSRGGEPVDGALAKTLGLDEVGFQSPTTGADGTTTEAALTVGKRLSSDLYLSYEQSLAGAVSTVSIFYDLSKRLTLRARAGTENAVDLIFTHRYD